MKGRPRKPTLKLVVKSLSALLVVAVLLIAGVWLIFGDGERLADLTTDPSLPADALERVVDLDYPPGNVAVSSSGRIFFTLHPDGHPPDKVMELVDGRPVPYPSKAFQSPRPDAAYFDSVLSLRVDRQNRLWTLDFARYGLGQPRLLAFDLATDELVHQYDFTPEIAGKLSMLNDFQVDAAGRKIYIAETSPLIHRPALIVYDIATRTARRLLHAHPSVMPENYVIQAPGRDMIIYGIYNMKIGVDSIALDRSGKWLYYGPVTGDRMYRVATADLDDTGLDAGELAARVQDFAAKTLSDGLTIDSDGNLYLSDMEHSAIVTLDPHGKLETLVKDPRLRWPDGFSFGPDGWLYVTCSSLHHVLFVDEDQVRDNAPYQIFRFKPGHSAPAGH
jgi:sugar lactone lactonase YvrE